MVAPRVEKAYEKYAWLIFFGLGLSGIVVSVIFSLTGMLFSQNQYQSDVTLGKTWSALQTSNPDVVKLNGDLVRLYAESWFGWSVFTAAISFKSFRRGEKWSWYALCMNPAILLYDLALETSFGVPFGYLASISLPTIVLAVLGLLLPYRKFFPKKP
jgi:hypothetical protein